MRSRINGIDVDSISGNLGKYFDNIKDAIRVLYAKALRNRGGNKSFVNFARIGDEERALLSKISGVDLSGAEFHGLDESGIVHLDNRHGVAEKRVDQLPVAEDDVVKIPDIIKGVIPEYLGLNSNGKHTFQYRKKIGNEYYYCEEYRSGRGKLVGMSLWKKKTGTTAAPVSTSNVTTGLTPEALRTRASSNNISDVSEKSSGGTPDEAANTDDNGSVRIGTE